MSDPRKPIFDAIRAAKAKPLRPEEEIVIDDLLDSINVPRAIPAPADHPPETDHGK